MTRSRLGVVVVVAALAVGAGPAAHALEGVVAGEAAPASGGWVSAWLGVGSVDSVLLANDGATDARTLDGTAAAPVFGVAVHYRTSRLDLGLLLEGLGSGRFAGLARDQRLGSQFRVAASLRWRYLDESWGALFVRLAPGLMVFGHSDALRAQAAELAGGDALRFEEVDEFGLGFTLGLDFGALVYLSRRVALSLQLNVLTNATSLRALGTDVSYTAIRGLFTVGLEWRM
ncbi:MAG: hypothetical protein CVU56_07540 [Deltaproteobacteria bacterium HGW-Deltaproteobacteria-14]|jgi:hypothetical protein|nr:MAG: hypothetical protein CVU56_07540 [Deltaproteobacteria bacterium HGW-Deltaproteobacteria-14]